MRRVHVRMRRDADLRRYAQAAQMRALGYSMDAIAERFGVSRQRAHQLVRQHERAQSMGATA